MSTATEGMTSNALNRWKAEPVQRGYPEGSWWVRSTDPNWPGVCAGGYFKQQEAESLAWALNHPLTAGGDYEWHCCSVCRGTGRTRDMLPGEMIDI